MRRVGIIGVAGAMLFLPSQPLEACGDKLLSMARAFRLHSAYTAWRSASILIYRVRNAGENTVKEPQLQLSLRQAGHKVATVENASQLAEALRSGQFDLVLADIGDASTLTRQVAPFRSNPLVLPVIYKPTKSEWTAAEKQFHFVLKAPLNSTQHLKAIDQAMKAKVRQASRI